MRFRGSARMWYNLLLQKILIIGMAACVALLTTFSADAQVAVSGDETVVVPEPRTITAALPQKAPERVVELYWYSDEGHICVDTYKVTLSRTDVVKNNPVSVRVRISRKCDGRAKAAPVPIKAVCSTRIGQKTGSSETLQPGSAAFAFTVTFPSAGNWFVTVVNHYVGNETHTVTVPVHVLAEPPIVPEEQPVAEETT